MESIFVLPAKPLLLLSRALFLQGHANLSFGHTRHCCVRNHCSLRLTPVGVYSPNVAGVSQFEVAEDYCVQQNTKLTEIDVDDKIETLVMEIKERLRSMNDGETSPSAYDTAWVARIRSKDRPNEPLFPSTLNWVLENQHEDGSWGEPSIFHLYDRLVCTLSCVLALKTWSKGEDHITKGLNFLQVHTQQLTNEAGNSRTCAFELAFPSMLNEARTIGLELPYDVPYLKKIFAMRERKISRIPVEMMHSVHTTLLYSLEALQELVDWERIVKLQSPDGSFLSSPAATVVTYMKTGNEKCLEYLTYIVNKFGNYAPSQYPIDLVERIWAVDTIERLGIAHHFNNEILNILDYVHRNIQKKGVAYGTGNPIADVDDTCMALRLLRLHGYVISPDILEHFKDENGEFICHQGETHRGVSDMFNLYRFSQISFPGEQILEEAQPLLKLYLQNCLENNQTECKWALKKAMHNEIENALRCPWNMSLQMVEAREYIHHYGETDLWIGKTVYWMHNVNNARYLELAKLDYNWLLVMYRRELHSVLKWWNHLGLDDPFVTRVLPTEIYFSISATLYEPEFKECRIAYTKFNCIEDILKHLFHEHQFDADLELLYQAVKKWNISLSHSLPTKLKVIFMAIYDTLNELAVQATTTQREDVFPYLHELRLKQIQYYLKNREIRKRKQLISWKEYVDDCKKDCNVAIRTVPAMFLMDEHLEDGILRCVDHRSNIYGQLTLYLRLLVDFMTHENMKGKQISTTMRSYMNEENCTEKEGMDLLEEMMKKAFQELVHEYLKPSQVPRCFRRLMFEHARATRFFHGDNIRTPLKQREEVNNVMEIFFTPI